MNKMLVLLLVVMMVITLTACDMGKRIDTALTGNGNGCSVTACTSEPVTCNYNIVTGKCE